MEGEDANRLDYLLDIPHAQLINLLPSILIQIDLQVTVEISFNNGCTVFHSNEDD